MKQQPELTIIELPVAQLVPYVRNAKEHSVAQVDTIAASISKFGNCDPISVWHNEKGEPEIVEGHGRVLALKKLGIEVAPVITLDHLSDEQRRACTHIHNQTTLNSGFDLEMLDLDLEELDFDWEDFGFTTEDLEDDDGLSDDYSQNIGEVLYEPKDTAHKVEDLYNFDKSRFDEVMARIDDDELRHMLELRAAWFVDFDFAKIADYYAYQATPEEQRAFEAMGLVLLDRDQLIENGFSNIMEMIDGGGSLK